MILITGKSTLANAIAQHLDNCTVVGRPDYDFTQQADCDQLINDFPNPNVLINTFGTTSGTSWQSMVTNFVAPVYLTEKYYNKLTNGHIINISSASAWWPSYPGITPNRFFYGISKLSLSEFGRQFNRSIIDDQKAVTVTTIEPGKFISPMSNYTGLEVDKIVDTIKAVIDSRYHHVSIVK